MAIRIDIASEFKDKGFKQADKATNSLQRNLKSLGKTLVGVLSVREVVQFGKASVRAFEEDERAATRLTQTLGNLGLAFEDSRVTAYIADLERASGVLDDKLRPSFQSLLTTTGSVTKAQELLGLALEVAAGSGQDVTTVAADLSKAYVGNTRSLAKYNIGLTRSELQTANFAEVQRLLAKQFSGQNAAYLDTYSGKVAVLNIAYANMQETVGQGLVEAFTILQGNKGIGGGVKVMDSFGDSIANTTRGIANLIAAFSDLRTYGNTVFEFFKNVDPFAPWTAITQMGKVKPKPFKTPMSISGATDAQNKIDAARKKAEQDAIKRAKELAALQKKQTAEQEKQKRLRQISAMLAQKEKNFDLQRIQLAAALGNKLTEDEKKRVLALQAIEELKLAIAEDDLTKAEKLLRELETLQFKTYELTDSLMELADVKSPFSTWKDDITNVIETLDKSAKNSVNDFLSTFRMGVNVISKELEAISFASQAEADMLLGDYYSALAQLSESQANLELLYSQFGGNLVEGLSISEKRLIDRYFAEGMQGDIQNPYRPDVNLNEIIAAITARNELYKTVQPTIAATQAQEESVAALAKAAADAALFAAEDLLAESITSNLNMGLTPNINVTINGSVITEQDLADTLTNLQYTQQRAGRGLIYSSRTI